MTAWHLAIYLGRLGGIDRPAGVGLSGAYGDDAGDGVVGFMVQDGGGGRCDGLPRYGSLYE